MGIARDGVLGAWVDDDDDDDDDAGCRGLRCCFAPVPWALK